MNRFDLDNNRFHSYLDTTKIRRAFIVDLSEDYYESLAEKKEIKRLAFHIYHVSSQNNLNLSFWFKLMRFLKYFKWSNNNFKSNGGKIDDSTFFRNEIEYHLNGLLNTSILSAQEIRELLYQSLRVYKVDSYYDVPYPSLEIKELSKCQNLQEFYSGEEIIDFAFAENLKNLRLVDLCAYDSDNVLGDYHYSYKRGKRNIKGLNFLQRCFVLHLMDSYVLEFEKIPSSIISLSVRNSNFCDISSIFNNVELEYLDISYTEIKVHENFSLKFQKLKILNVCSLSFQNEEEKLSFFKHLNSHGTIEIIIIEKLTYNWLIGNSILNSELQKSIIVDSARYDIGFLSSNDVVEILNIADRYKYDKDIRKSNPPVREDLKQTIENKLNTRPLAWYQFT